MLLLPDVRFKLLDVLGRIWDGLVETDLEPLKRDQVEGFLKVQIDTLRTELEKDAPNELVVSGTLGATLALADRLSTDYGPAVVDRRSVAAPPRSLPAPPGRSCCDERGRRGPWCSPVDPAIGRAIWSRTGVPGAIPIQNTAPITSLAMS